MSKEPIHFYDLKKKWKEFSNFFPAEIIVDGITYPTSEHYFQAAKFLGPEASEVDREYALLVAQQNTPNKAFILAKQKEGGGYKWRTDLNTIIREYKEHGVRMREDWDTVKDNVMRKAVYLKFSTHPNLTEVLCSTGTREIAEHTPRDRYWGDGGDGSGKSMLGQILMETRALVPPPGKRLGNQWKIFPTPPTQKSNWVIPGILIATNDPAQTPGDVIKYLDAGINTFINLMEDHELEEGKSKYGNIPYEVEAGAEEEMGLVDKVKCMVVDYQGEKVIFGRVPTVDMRIMSDAAALELAKTIVWMIGIGKRVLVHCRGGKGRTGTIIGIILGLLYEMDQVQTLQVMKSSFQSRINRRGPAPRMPQTKSQRDQIKRIIE